MTSRGRTRAVASAVLLLAGGWAAVAPASAAPPPADTMAQRMRACTPCHGEQGRDTNAGYFPRIAGKPAGYLHNQLLNFRDGRRNNVSMTYLVSHLSESYLREIAEYFAALELPYPPPQTSGAPAAQLARGEALVRHGDAARGVPACTACHGPAMTGAQPAMPGLLGLPRDYLVAQLGAWKTGQRRAHAPDCMAQIVQRLGDDDITALTTWLSSQPLPASPAPAAAVPEPLPLACGSGLR